MAAVGKSAQGLWAGAGGELDVVDAALERDVVLVGAEGERRPGRGGRIRRAALDGRVRLDDAGALRRALRDVDDVLMARFL